MRTIRGRLTVSFALALAVTLVVFAVTISVLEQRQERAAVAARVALDRHIVGGVNRVVGIIADVRAAGPVVVATGDLQGYFVPAERLAFLEDYVIIYGSRDAVLFTSDSVRALIAADGEFEQLAAVGRTAPGNTVGSMELGDVGPLRYAVRSIGNAGPDVTRILYATPEEVGPSPLLVAIVTSTPIILIAASFVGYLIAGRTLKPVDVIINEIEAITDGRSLHRRVIEMETTEELMRLGTTLNNMLVRLERSFLSLRRFTADASHELKTPLTVLRAGVERAITHPQATPEVLAVLEETLIEANRMTELVDSLLTLARADEGRAPLHLERMDVRELLNEVAETGSMLGEQARVSVDVTIPDSPVLMHLDRSRARQLFMNLLTNAIKYTPAGGSVKVDCRPDGAEVVLTVSDTGIGMARGELEHVFDRFWRADVARSRWGDRPGVGLGLAISKWIAEAHGGTIAVTSERGRGSTFTVTLPTGLPGAT